MNKYDVIILGAGAAGLMCAITAGKRGKSILVLERANKIGKKILMSGGGRCNFTNLEIDAEHYISGNPDFCKSALSRYTQHDFISLVNEHKIPFHEKIDGQLFCDQSSKDIVGMLRAECSLANVAIKNDCDTLSIEKNDEEFRLKTSCGNFVTGKLVIATGGLSVPTLGGSDYGYRVARQFGHEVSPTRAGLVPFVFTDDKAALFRSLSGISVRAGVSTSNTTFTGDILFTHRGLSGPSVLQLSSYWQESTEIRIDLLPELANGFLLQQKHEHPRQHLQTILTEHLPRRLVTELLQIFAPDRTETGIGDIPDKVLKGVENKFKNWSLVPAGTEGYRTAEVTLGGVGTKNLSSKTMESRLCPGLYFIGEVVDVTGHLGGFNFQWAWASGVAAGNAV